MEKPIDNVQNDEAESANHEGGDSKESKRRSYPVRELKYIIEFVTKIYNELGANQFHSKEDIAKIHNLSPEYIKKPLSTCQQYRLLDLKHGVGYKVSALFVKIHKPLSEDERLSAIIESIRSIEIFNKLIQDYSGHSVPSLSGISNNIHRGFDLKTQIAQKVAELFVRNLNDFNLVDLSGQLTLKPNVKKQEQEKPKDDVVNPPDEKNSVVINIPLKDGRKAYITIPENYTSADLLKISKFVDALKDE
jgi:hypothetical protein